MSSRPASETRALPRDHPHFPVGLRDLEDAPSRIYVRGALPPALDSAVAIVGSRAASSYGRAIAERLAADLARLGLAVVSGLARGIDASAHRGALAAGGATWAVVPSGLDRITPRHHQQLADAIAQRGGLLTEIEHDGPRWASDFIARNRLIAALAGATVVVEAAVRSGALSTAAAARRLGRKVLAVPGDVDRETARGCHQLLRRGALLCENASDVLRALDRAGLERGAAERSPRATAESRLWSALASDPCPVESIAARAGVTLDQALAGLLALEWAGSARAWPGQRWARVPR